MWISLYRYQEKMKPLDSLRFLGPVGKCHPATESTWVRFGLSGTPLSLDMCEQIRVKAIVRPKHEVGTEENVSSRLNVGWKGSRNWVIDLVWAHCHWILLHALPTFVMLMHMFFRRTSWSWRAAVIAWSASKKAAAGADSDKEWWVSSA